MSTIAPVKNRFSGLTMAGNEIAGYVAVVFVLGAGTDEVDGPIYIVSNKVDYPYATTLTYARVLLSSVILAGPDRVSV
jgi:hypothetical protein